MALASRGAGRHDSPPVSPPRRLAIFDWDGTLMDSVPRIVSSLQASARELGLPVPPEEAARGVIGLELDLCFRTLFVPLSEPQRLALHAVFREHYVTRDPTPTPLFPHAREVLEGLRAEGWLLAVATGKVRRGLERVWGEVAPLFHASRCADECPSKPDPAMVRELLAELGVAPGRAVVVGDTDFDLQMARRAGVPSVAAAYGAQPLAQLLPWHPRAVLRSLAELPRVLRAWDAGAAG
jgi:phosphoglycolate phosphatase